MVNRIVAALLLLTWIASLGRCVAEQYGYLHEAPGLECCDHEHEHDSQHESAIDFEEKPAAPGDDHQSSIPCGICQMLDQSGVSLTKFLVLEKVSDWPSQIGRLDVPEWLSTAAAEVRTDECLRPPIGRLSWGAYLIQTSLPVRGPDRA